MSTHDWGGEARALLETVLPLWPGSTRERDHAVEVVAAHLQQREVAQYNAGIEAAAAVLDPRDATVGLGAALALRHLALAVRSLKRPEPA